MRDLLTGSNFVDQNVPTALALASTSQHPNCVWLCKLFADHPDEQTPESAKIVLKSSSDVRAKVLAAIVHGVWDLDKIKEAAVQGDAFAQSIVSMRMDLVDDDADLARFAQLAADQNERDGFASLALDFDMHGRAPDKARSLYEKAAKLGSVFALSELGFHFEDYRRWAHWSQALLLGESQNRYLISNFADQVRIFEADGDVEPRTLFVIGKCLFKIGLNRLNLNEPDAHAANQAIQFYIAQITAARQAVDAWTLVGIKKKIVKDVRKLIGQEIWNARQEASYDAGLAFFRCDSEFDE